METREELFAKRYHNKPPSFSASSQPNVNTSSRPKKEYYHLIQPYPKSLQYEEPIDLTQNPSRLIKTDDPHLKIKPRGRRPKMYCFNEVADHTHLQGFFKDMIDMQATENKQVEILKAAKSLFSKRTRTLYHWMYPNTPKQQIKLAVANSWENLGVQEKQFYISQVLVRFGFPQCNLMVNPQLGGIKELPLVPTSGATKELQTAISSISKASSAAAEGKKKQGRPPGSKNKKTRKDPFTYKITKDFQDDPELSKELEKFAITFDCFK